VKNLSKESWLNVHMSIEQSPILNGHTIKFSVGPFGCVGITA